MPLGIIGVKWTNCKRAAGQGGRLQPGDCHGRDLDPSRFERPCRGPLAASLGATTRWRPSCGSLPGRSRCWAKLLALEGELKRVAWPVAHSPGCLLVAHLALLRPAISRGRSGCIRAPSTLAQCRSIRCCSGASSSAVATIATWILPGFGGTHPVGAASCAISDMRAYQHRKRLWTLAGRLSALLCICPTEQAIDRTLERSRGRPLRDDGIRLIGADYQADKKALASDAFSRFHIRLNK